MEREGFIIRKKIFLDGRTDLMRFDGYQALSVNIHTNYLVKPCTSIKYIFLNRQMYNYIHNN